MKRTRKLEKDLFADYLSGEEIKYVTQRKHEPEENNPFKNSEEFEKEKRYLIEDMKIDGLISGVMTIGSAGLFYAVAHCPYSLNISQDIPHQDMSSQAAVCALITLIPAVHFGLNFLLDVAEYFIGWQVERDYKKHRRDCERYRL